jgi:hypothetical protein
MQVVSGSSPWPMILLRFLGLTDVLTGSGLIIMIDGLSRLPSMDHGEVLREFSARVYIYIQYTRVNQMIGGRMQQHA